ncbi:LysE family transporter [Roseibium sp. CAU 1637]|uniref:LysE family transporter n=1 Tax=Roseibium limicola TaxID=2816037 RepID=A0A939EQG1_9HYPH|nr:LysE family transporter [Roseibium limicola]MBO0346633.1 LysE family transporter [Roseibium limicola]
MSDVHLPLILGALFVAAASPGPATMAIAGTSMASGRRMGMTLGLGVFCGSVTWSFAAAFGLAAVMLAHAWVFEVMRYIGAAYLLYLAVWSAKAAWSCNEARTATPISISSPWKAFRNGLALHITNPKAILFYGSVYSIGLPTDTTPQQLATVMASLAATSFTIFIGYGWLFSIPKVRSVYGRTSRWFNGAFALLFGLVGIKLLTTRII